MVKLKPPSRESLVFWNLFIVAVSITCNAAFSQSLTPIPDSNQGVHRISFEHLQNLDGHPGPDLVIGSVSSVLETRDANVLVADTRVPCVYKFDPKGRHIATFGQGGDGPGDLPMGARITLDNNGNVLVGGRNGDIQILDIDWNYKDGFQRENVGEMIRSIGVLHDGGVLVGVLGIMDQTTIDVYAPDHSYSGSFASTFAEKGEDWRYEKAYAGAYFCIAEDGSIYYAQLTPYEIRHYSPTFELVAQTDDGGAKFVPIPPRPDFSGGRIKISRRWGVNGIAQITEGNIVTSSWRKLEDGNKRTLICAYSPDLELIARTEFADYHAIKGADRSGNVFLFSKDDHSNRVTRAAVQFHD